jgi:hypothetical protein
MGWGRAAFLVAVLMVSSFVVRTYGAACAAGRAMESTRARLTLLRTSDPLSMITDIQRRRLEEQYCWQFAQCVLEDASTESRNRYFQSAYSSCLRDQIAEDKTENKRSKIVGEPAQP